MNLVVVKPVAQIPFVLNLSYSASDSSQESMNSVGELEQYLYELVACTDDSPDDDVGSQDSNERLLTTNWYSNMTF